jgi:hypothetical protein
MAAGLDTGVVMPRTESPNDIIAEHCHRVAMALGDIVGLL